jgi:hypothetical protein
MSDTAPSITNFQIIFNFVFLALFSRSLYHGIIGTEGHADREKCPRQLTGKGIGDALHAFLNAE